MSFEAHTNDLTLMYDLVRYCMIMLAGGHLALYDTLNEAMMKVEQVFQWMALMDAWTTV